MSAAPAPEGALPARSRALIVSLVPVICPPEAPALGLADQLADHVALTVGSMPRGLRAAFLLGLRTYDEGARTWLPARGRAARALPPDLAERYYLRWEHGPTPVHVQLARALGQLLKLAHYEHPVIQERLGYRPAGWIDQVKRRRLATYGDAVRAAEAAVVAPDPLRSFASGVATAPPALRMNGTSAPPSDVERAAAAGAGTGRTGS